MMSRSIISALLGTCRSEFRLPANKIKRPCEKRLTWSFYFMYRENRRQEVSVWLFIDKVATHLNAQVSRILERLQFLTIPPVIRCGLY